MMPPRMVGAETPDRGRVWYLVDANLDFVSEVKLFLDWKVATKHAPATMKAYCFRLLWFYRFLAQQQLRMEEATATHLDSICHLAATPVATVSRKRATHSTTAACGQ